MRKEEERRQKIAEEEQREREVRAAYLYALCFTFQIIFYFNSFQFVLLAFLVSVVLRVDILCMQTFLYDCTF